MAKKAPWYAVKAGVYHDNTECKIGNKIKPENKRSGTGEKRKCKRCVELDDQGK